MASYETRNTSCSNTILGCPRWAEYLQRNSVQRGTNSDMIQHATEMLKILHTSHAGIVKTKQLARHRIYWPGINKQIEDMTNKCEACSKNRPKQQKEPMTIHPLPSLPWNKVGTEVFEHKGNHYLILVDYYSNFVEVAPLQHDTKSVTVFKHIKANIARYGIMETLISDNGPQFVSDAFAKFVKAYGMKHVTSSPTYPQSNGLAEKAVQTAKKMMTKCEEAGDDIYLALLDLRNTPRDDITGSPMQRLQGRRAQTRLPTADSLLIPSSSQPTVVYDKMMEYRRKQKLYHDRRSKSLQDSNPTMQSEYGLQKAGNQQSSKENMTNLIHSL